jgi:hypothetical protein
MALVLGNILILSVEVCDNVEHGMFSHTSVIWSSGIDMSFVDELRSHIVPHLSQQVTSTLDDVNFSAQVGDA